VHVSTIQGIFRRGSETSVCIQIVEKAQQAGERLAKNMKRGEQLSLMQMKEELKRNAKLLEMDKAALQVGVPDLLFSFPLRHAVIS
jgi:hypothetical protein